MLLHPGYTLGELLEALEKRQNGLDIEQSEVRAQIGKLLEKDWLEALEACEALLGTTSDTLQELYRTLLSENTSIKQGLNEIYEQAEEHDRHKVLETIENIYNRLEQLEQWGKERVASWSQYYRRVNDFLQSIVRFDPNREFSQKLKERIRIYPEDPWFLEMLEAPVYRAIREVNIAPEKERVTRVLQDRPTDDAETDDDGNLVLDKIIEDLKGRVKGQRTLDLVEVLQPYLEEYPLDKVYPHIGTLIDLILKESRHRPENNYKWISPVPQLELQNLTTRLLSTNNGKDEA
ncbi:MAG: hypothetical protein GY866_41725 [Proteobacteria bacterium]|nr:hypothetical protein [Pseudomonadota bacterium]